MTLLQRAAEELIEADHPARAIWELVATLDLTCLEEETRSFEGEAGSPRWPPAVLLSVWLYAYQHGIASAREIERRMEWEPGLCWLCGLQVINAHTLSDSRMRGKETLEQLFTQLLAVLSAEGLVDFNTIVQDGTKIQARVRGKDQRSAVSTESTTCGKRALTGKRSTRKPNRKAVATASKQRENVGRANV